MLCSDGLSDLVTSAQMIEVIERYAGDAGQVAEELVAAANRAGGKDNVTAVFVAGAEFVGAASPAMSDARARHAITKVRAAVEAPVSAIAALGRLLRSRAAFLAYGFVIGVVVALAWR